MDFRITVEPVEDKASKPGLNVTSPKTFPTGVDQIAFGRERTNDLVFPPEARIVSRNHGRFFRQRSGDYAVEAFGDHYIEIDGYPAERGQHLKDGALIRLGDKTGPVIRVRLEEVAASDADGGRTLTQRAVQPVAKVLAQMGRYQLAGLAAILVVAAAVAWLALRVPSLEGELASLRESVTASAQAEFESTDALRQSAYAVIMRGRDGQESLQGTAWAYEPGILVTNAHVAILYERLRPGETLIVRPPGGNGTDHTVTGNRLHPGYLAFLHFLQEADTISSGFRAMTRGIAMPSAYDVGVLEVDNGDALAPGIPLAASPGADVVRPGMALAFAGYPIEGVASQHTAQISPTPQLQFGAVTSVTDFFLFGADADGALLVQNSLPATGGASGSAVINKDGQVVAVLSGGTVMATDTGRAPSAVLLNYAQRVDLIAAALDPALFDVAAARAGWLDVLARFDAHETAMVDSTKTALAKETGGAVGEADLVVPSSLSASSAVRAGTAQYQVHEVAVQAGRTYSFLVYGDLDGSLSMALFRDGKGIGGAGGGRWFANVVFTAERDETIQLRIIGEAANPVGYKLYVFSAETPAATALSSG